MSAHFRAAALIRELRSLLAPTLRAARSIPFRLADHQRETARGPAITPRPPSQRRLFLESALDAAKSLRAPISTNSQISQISQNSPNSPIIAS
jgi:hypothetical protein